MSSQSSAASSLSSAARRRARGKKLGRLCVLASLPLASEAYHSIGGLAATRSVGPLHASASSFVVDSPFSVGSGSCTVSSDDRVGVSDQHRTRMSATSACEAHTSKIPTRLRASSVAASSVVPPSSYLSHRCPSRRICVLGSPAADRYGGRAWGTPSVTDIGGGGGGVAFERSAPGGGGTLGFVIDDADGIGRSTSASTTKLSMVSRLFDGEPTSPTDAEDSSLSSLKRENKSAGGNGSTIRTVSSSTSSPLKKRVAESLLGITTSSLSEDLAELNAFASKPKVPAWFPWLPTLEQIRMLKGSELREACAERGLEETGKKDKLRSRLQEWTKEQHERRVLDRRVGLSSTTMKGSGSATTTRRSPLDDMIDEAKNEALTPGRKSGRNRGAKSSSSSSRSMGESDLFNRRRELRRSKYSGTAPDADKLDDTDDLSDEEGSSPFTSTDESRAALTKLFETAPAKYSNIEIKQMYKAAKKADKNGDRRLSRSILLQLREATPNDSRILRRLARLDVESGDLAGAREVLQEGLRRNPNDAHLLQGLASIELKSGDDDAARGLYKEAIRADSKLPNAYHALGTLEHSRGNIRVATTVLRAGLKACPTNHRLHHALGDLYREARMLDVAELSYRRALKHSPEWGESFAHTALAFLSYERGDLTQCRQRLHEAVEVNEGAHSQGWLALVNLEESEGRVNDAREIYREAAARYERRRISRSFVPTEDDVAGMEKDESSSSSLPSLLGPPKGKKPSPRGGDTRRRSVVRPNLSGDKWIFVYKSWARMEEHHGTFESADRVYHRATRVFPGNVQLNLDWARLHANAGRAGRARNLFEYACRRAGSRRADPYRLYAEFEMNLGNFPSARSILYRGAQSLSESRDGGSAQSEDLARLYHTWALCEWHLGNLDRTEVLFDHALRLTDAGQKGSEMRSLILYSVARFLYGARGENILAQHCVCLSLKENFMPGGNAKIWLLWADIARAMENEDLAERCREQADKLSNDGSDNGGATGLSRLLFRDATTDDEEGVDAASLPMISGPAMQRMLRREPWHHKVAGASGKESKNSWYDGVPFPELSGSRRAESSAE